MQLSVPIAIIMSSFTILLFSVFHLIQEWRFALILSIIISIVSIFLIKNMEDKTNKSSSRLPLIDAIRND